MTARQYTFRILLGTLLLSALFFLVNLLVDPLDIYRFYKQHGVNAFKPKYSSYARIAKPIQIERYQYEWLVLGSSRVLLGMPTTGFDSPIPEAKRFNAGVWASTISMVNELFHHAVAVSEVKEVVISTDFFMFNAYNQGHYVNRLATPDETGLQRVERKTSDVIETLFGPQMTSSSVYTLTRQQQKYDKIRSDGQGINEREIEKAIKRGYRAQFESYENGFSSNLWTPCSNNAFTTASKQIDTLQVLRELLQLAGEKKIRVRLFISPVHARMQEALYITGLWPAYEQWKIDLARTVAEMAQQYPVSETVLWDFSGYNAFTNEPLPEALGVPMAWHLEASHFRDTLGLLVLKTMYSGDTSLYPAIKLTPQNVVEHNQKIARDQAAYRATHQAQFDEMSARITPLVNDRRLHGWDCSVL